ncbi:hypothetical protein PR202_gb11777 [Eleusine coracana subsp. coracana]|uniref:Uncharacterized protein n=1 Tax=Eleusine coracana subsp. coracana TaxID=191504 RepID=A0AAV5ENG8_ELECO|nr:hypothetical protein PR202_gb11777 [Eleusine coracana subsp. coracana]
MPPARRRRRGATSADESIPSSAAGLLAHAATLIPEVAAATAASLKAPPQLKELVHSLPANHPLLLSLPQTLALAISSDPNAGAASTSDSPPPTPPRAAGVLLLLLLTHPSHPPRWDDILRPLALLHDRLALLATADPSLASLAVACFELVWRADAPGRDALIAQTLPYLVAQALTASSSARPVLRRLFALRDALPLLDYADESIFDFKMLLLRCFVSPLFLKAEEGRKFLALVLGVSEGTAREGLELIKAQVGMTGVKRAAVVAYGEVVFRAWKDGGWVRGEIGEGFLQDLVEAAVHAANKEVAKAARKILWAFVEQRAVAGVEKLVFRLAEPVLFRSLQVASSNVRHNALHLLLDLFPLEDPDVTKDVNDPLLEKQFYLLDKLLMDDCPEIRTVAVEGICRVLNQYWEVVPSPVISKFLRKIVDDMSKDSCNEISALSVRVAAVDLLLAIRDLRSFQYTKVIGLDTLLSSLANDHPRLNSEQIDGLIIAAVNLMKSLSDEGCSGLAALREFFTNAKLKLILKTVASESARAALLTIAPVVLPDDLSVLHEVCMDIVANAASRRKKGKALKKTPASDHASRKGSAHIKNLAPLLAYLSLATNSALPDVDQTGISCSEVSSTSEFPPLLIDLRCH